jgi:hypothetical protein
MDRQWLTGENSDRVSKRRAGIALFAFVAALTTLACTCFNFIDPGQLVREVAPPEVNEFLEAAETIEAQVAPPTPGPSGGVALPSLLNEGRLDLDSIGTTSPGETQGRILSVQVTNSSTGEIVVEVPCGLVFQPDDSADQRMMTIQTASASVPAAGSAELSPYVICIDPGKFAPNPESTYGIGVMAEANLLKLAECLCAEPLEGQVSLEAGMQHFGIQFAVWSVSTGEPLDEFFAGGFGEGSAAGGLMDDEMAELFGGIQEMMLEPARQLLERCDVEVKPQ